MEIIIYAKGGGEKIIQNVRKVRVFNGEISITTETGAEIHTFNLSCDNHLVSIFDPDLSLEDDLTHRCITAQLPDLMR